MLRGGSDDDERTSKRKSRTSTSAGIGESTIESKASGVVTYCVCHSRRRRAASSPLRAPLAAVALLDVDADVASVVAGAGDVVAAKSATTLGSFGGNAGLTRAGRRWASISSASRRRRTASAK